MTTFHFPLTPGVEKLGFSNSILALFIISVQITITVLRIISLFKIIIFKYIIFLPPFDQCRDAA